MSRYARQVAAWALTIAWAAFWIFFVLASAWSEPGPFGTKLLVSVIGVGVLLAGVLVPLVNTRGGGALLIVEGAALFFANFTFFHNPPPTQIFLLLTLAFPPLAAGMLFLAAGPNRRATTQ